MWFGLTATRQSLGTLAAVLALSSLLGLSLASAQPAPEPAPPAQPSPPQPPTTPAEPTPPAQPAPKPPAQKPVDEAARASARRSLDEGIKLFKAGDYAPAATKLDEAYNTLQQPSSGVWSARAFVKLGKLVEASERYQAVMKLAKPVEETAADHHARAEAERERGALMPKIPLLHIQVQGAKRDDVAVTIDGEPVARVFIADEAVFNGKKAGWFTSWKSLPVNPGSHKLLGQWQKEANVLPVSVKEGEKQEVVLRFGPARIAEEEKQGRAQRLASCQSECRKDCEEDQPCFRKCKRGCIARHSNSNGARTID
ncbi:MAG: hypothetical protein ABW217_09380 [Polyangiaceae bacterium]